MRMGKSYSSSSIARGCRSSLVDGIVRHWSALGGVGGRASGDASSMRFTKILKQHWGCVNALALGRKTDIAGCDDGVGASTGEVLLTGGDDTRILVWNIRNHEPVASFLGN